MSILVRAGGVDELDSVEPLWRAMQAHHAELTADRFPMRDADESWVMRRAEYLGWLSEGGGMFLLARSGEALVGYAFLRWQPAGPTWDFGTVIGEVESLAVASSARGSGVGTALLDACRAELAGRGIAHWQVAVVETNAAVRLYERAGFRGNYRVMFGSV